MCRSDIAMKRLVEEYLGKDKMLYVAFMDLEKAFGRTDREALWSVLKLYGVDGQLLKGIQAFYRGKCMCMCEGGRIVKEEGKIRKVDSGVRECEK